MQRPAWLDEILEEQKIHRLLGDPGTEPNMLEGKWKRLEHHWKKFSTDIWVRDGSDSRHPYNVKDNPDLIALIDKTFKGYMRVFATCHEAWLLRNSTFWKDPKERESIARTITESEEALRDISRYAQCAQDRLINEGGLNPENAYKLMGSIIRYSRQAFLAVFPDVYMGVPQYALRVPEKAKPDNPKPRSIL